jgi:hypothetical protein
MNIGKADRLSEELKLNKKEDAEYKPTQVRRTAPGGQKSDNCRLGKVTAWGGDFTGGLGMMNADSNHVIRSEKKLLSWLLSYTQSQGETRSYPKGIVDLAEFVLRHLRIGVDETLIFERFAPENVPCSCCGQSTTSVLGLLLQMSSNRTPLRAYNSQLIELVGKLLWELHFVQGPLTRREAIWSALHISGLCHGNFINVEFDDGVEYISTTAVGERKLGAQVKIAHSVIERHDEDDEDYGAISPKPTLRLVTPGSDLKVQSGIQCTSRKMARTGALSSASVEP